jgi:hypothetical protein
MISIRARDNAESLFGVKNITVVIVKMRALKTNKMISLKVGKNVVVKNVFAKWASLRIPAPAPRESGCANWH